MKIYTYYSIKLDIYVHIYYIIHIHIYIYILHETFINTNIKLPIIHLVQSPTH